MSIKDLNVSLYNSKYLKYKNKYLTLKKMIGGGNSASNNSTIPDEELVNLNIVYIDSRDDIMHRTVSVNVQSTVQNIITTFIVRLVESEYTVFEASTFTKLEPEITVKRLLKLKKRNSGIISLIIYSNQSRALQTYLEKLLSIEKNEDEQTKIKNQSSKISYYHLSNPVAYEKPNVSPNNIELNMMLLINNTSLHFTACIKEEELSLKNIHKIINDKIDYDIINSNFIILDKNDMVIENDFQLFIAHEKNKYTSLNKTLFLHIKELPKNTKEVFASSVLHTGALATSMGHSITQIGTLATSTEHIKHEELQNNTKEVFTPPVSHTGALATSMVNLPTRINVTQEQLKNKLKNAGYKTANIEKYFLNTPYCIGICKEFLASDLVLHIDDKTRDSLSRTFEPCNCRAFYKFYQ